jgi:hypothetical protein
MTSDAPSSSGVILWQSFDHPSDTLLPGMKIGKNLWTGGGWSLSSWRSPRDPSPGRYRYTTDARGVPENVLLDGDVERYRTGPWNGLWFSGVPEMTTYADMFAYQLTRSPGEVTYGYTARPGAPFSSLLLTDTGVVWDATTCAWRTFFQAPRDVCDPYGKCGASTSFCGCPKGFDPASPAEWRMRDSSGGCRRNASLGSIAGNGTGSCCCAGSSSRTRARPRLTRPSRWRSAARGAWPIAPAWPTHRWTSGEAAPGVDASSGRRASSTCATWAEGRIST